MTPHPLAAILESRAFGYLARALLTFPFWLSGLIKLSDFSGAEAEMAVFGLEPTAFFAMATVVTQLAGSALVIQGRHAWLGAGALAVFTALTIPIAHDFWARTGQMAVIELHFAVEHIGMIGGLAVAAAQAQRETVRRAIETGRLRSLHA